MIKLTATYRDGDTMIIERNITVPCSKRISDVDTMRISDVDTMCSLSRFAASFIELKFNIPHFVSAIAVTISDIVVCNE